MAKLIVKVATGKPGSECVKEVEIDLKEYRNPDGSPDTFELEDIAREEMFNMISWNFEIVE